uniref:Uncharacterized protein n=1 Tax=Amphimedon queenslandica TaxID=400682 RepID=A0A1X7T4L9_AMPQE
MKFFFIKSSLIGPERESSESNTVRDRSRLPPPSSNVVIPTKDNCTAPEVAAFANSSIDLENQSDTTLDHLLTFDDTGSIAKNEENLLSIESNVENDIVAVFRAFKISDEMCGSQKDFIKILEYGRDLYCKGDSELLAKWPKSLAASLKLLKSHGYIDPATYYICLDKSHPSLWSNQTKLMRFATIVQNPEQLSITNYY